MREKTKKILILTIIIGGLLVLYTPTLAHPGNTASDGCHYCRTNCDYWGVAWNQRHCHGGSDDSIDNSGINSNKGNDYIDSPNKDSSSNFNWWIVIGIGFVCYIIYKK
ncbi:MAG: hypothetical protein Q8N16_02480 [bacterium]|nr:hypothetical protein [bacterium]